MAFVICIPSLLLSLSLYRPCPAPSFSSISLYMSSITLFYASWDVNPRYMFLFVLLFFAGLCALHLLSIVFFLPLFSVPRACVYVRLFTFSAFVIHPWDFRVHVNCAGAECASHMDVCASMAKGCCVYACRTVWEIKAELMALQAAYFSNYGRKLHGNNKMYRRNDKEIAMFERARTHMSTWNWMNKMEFKRRKKVLCESRIVYGKVERISNHDRVRANEIRYILPAHIRAFLLAPLAESYSIILSNKEPCSVLRPTKLHLRPTISEFQVEKQRNIEY